MQLREFWDPGPRCDVSKGGVAFNSPALVPSQDFRLAIRPPSPLYGTETLECKQALS